MEEIAQIKGAEIKSRRHTEGMASSKWIEHKFHIIVIKLESRRIVLSLEADFKALKMRLMHLDLIQRALENH